MPARRGLRSASTAHAGVENDKSPAVESRPSSPSPHARSAKVAAPVRMSSSARLSPGRECGSNSWRTAPKEKFCSSGAPRAARTVRPRPRASSAAARNSDVLPMPAGPSTTMRRPRALSASARQRSSSPSSRSRSSREPTPRSPDTASAPRPRVTTRLWQYWSEPEGAKSSVDKGQKLRAAATMPDGHAARTLGAWAVPPEQHR